MFNDFIYLQGGLRICLFPVSSSDIFYFVAFESKLSSGEAVDGLSGDVGVKVD